MVEVQLTHHIALDYLVSDTRAVMSQVRPIMRAKLDLMESFVRRY